MKIEVRDLARNLWPQILIAAGIDAKFLHNHHGPCPICGGTDRFRFDDKDGSGSHYCSKCGAGDGLSLLMKHKECSFNDAACFVRNWRGDRPVEANPVVTPQTNAEKSDKEKYAKRQKIWREGKLIQPGDPVWKYLTQTRQLPIEGTSPVLRYHPALAYFDFATRKFVGKFPAMLAVVQGKNREVIGMHKTYLTMDGRKADVSEPKKSEKITKLSGGAIRLFKHGKKLAVSEGIETALAVHAMKGVPSWACLNKVLLSQVEVPDDIEELDIYADNDQFDDKGHRAGQDAAVALADRMTKEGRKARIILPTRAGMDFADIWCADRARRKVA
jgi:putative DNA primase/helicase